MTSREKFQHYFNEYSGLGFRMVALRGKSPYMKGWKKWGNGAVQSALDKESWVNLGIQTGKVSRLLVYDFDDQLKAEQFHQELVSEGMLTTEVITGGDRGSRHFYFKLPDNCKAAPGRIFNGGDLKGDGGLVVAPPSLHPDTRKEYKFIETLKQLRCWTPKINLLAGIETKDLTPEPAVFRIRGMADKKGLKCISVIKNLILREGERNDSLFFLYCLLRQNDDSPEYAANQVREVNRRANPPLPEKEIARICSERAKKYYIGCQKIREKFCFDTATTCEACRYYHKKGAKMISSRETAKALQGRAFNLAAKLYFGVKMGEFDLHNKTEVARQLHASPQGLRKAIERLDVDGLQVVPPQKR